MTQTCLAGRADGGDERAELHSHTQQRTSSQGKKVARCRNALAYLAVEETVQHSDHEALQAVGEKRESALRVEPHCEKEHLEMEPRHSSLDPDWNKWPGLNVLMAPVNYAAACHFFFISFLSYSPFFHPLFPSFYFTSSKFNYLTRWWATGGPIIP